MRVNLKRMEMLPGQKRTVAEEVNGSPEWLAGMHSQLDGGIAVTLTIEHTQFYWVILGQISAPVRLTCSRCLDEYNRVITGSFERIAVAPDAKVLREAADEVYLPLEEGSVDLSQAIEETLVLNIPMVPLCRENCSGLCPVCGQNLNHGSCSCKVETIDPRLEKLRELL